MTYKYLAVRRELYERNPSNKLNTYRSFSDIMKLYKRSFWIMLVILVITFLCLVATTILTTNSPYILLYMIIIILVLVLIQIPRERYFYNELERANELSKKMQEYEQYVSEVWNILQDCGIDTPEKVQNLKTECEKTLKTREDKFMKINSKIVDMLIGVPLGALIASLIYADGKAVPIAIGTISLGGLAILGILKLVYLISYYSEGYFRDNYMLEALSELDYY